ncbi:MAG TPA: hypothetical protein LFV90_02105 [Rickettsia endosymbiont of Columbicola hoogstraali]|nr:hypothetical protein [Rickettsia endosymbiont of Columbicola hoogstraali]
MKAENTAQQKSNIIGIVVGLYVGYAAAHRLYIKNGYISDGQGIAYNDQTLNFGAETILDDNLVLFFTKKIK